MNRRIVRSLVVVAALILVIGVAAQAQAQAPASGVKLGFDFAAAGKVYVRGTYSVDIAADKVVLTSEKGTAIEFPIVKKSDRSVSRTELVFDIVGSSYNLAEVYVPGKGGAKVRPEPKSNERETVKGPKA